VAPGGVGIAVALALRAVLGQEPLAVRVGAHVARVDADMLAHRRKFGAQRRHDAIQAGAQQGRVLAQLDGEAIAGPLGRGAAEGVRERRVLGDQASRASPGRQRVEALDEARPNERPRAVALAG